VERTDCVQLLQIRRRLVASQSSQTFFARRYIAAVLLAPRPPHRELLGKRQIEERIGLGNKIGDDRARHAMPRHGEKADLFAGARNPTPDLEAVAADTCGCRTAARSITGKSPLIGLTL
jgi:hypothetical protein